MKQSISYVVWYINEHINDKTDQNIINLLNSYLTSSYCFEDSNYSYQPGFKNISVVEYDSYPDVEMAYKHKTNRLLLTFDDNTVLDISLHKFKKYARRIFMGSFGFAINGVKKYGKQN
jgi:hypothetical protein